MLNWEGTGTNEYSKMRQAAPKGYPRLDHAMVDGGSAGGTLEIPERIYQEDFGSKRLWPKQPDAIAKQRALRRQGFLHIQARAIDGNLVRCQVWPALRGFSR